MSPCDLDRAADLQAARPVVVDSVVWARWLSEIDGRCCVCALRHRRSDLGALPSLGLICIGCARRAILGAGDDVELVGSQILEALHPRLVLPRKGRRRPSVVSDLPRLVVDAVAMQGVRNVAA